MGSPASPLPGVSRGAHAIDKLDDMHFGVLTARRAGLRKGDVLNTRTAKQVAKFVQAKRRRPERLH